MTNIDKNQISAACLAWQAAKRAEDAAKAERVSAENLIIDLLGFSKDEGSQTFKTDDGWKAVLTAKLDRKLDEEKWLEVENQFPVDMRPIKIKRELDTKGVNWLKNNAPTLYSILSSCMTIKPAKTGVKIERLDGSSIGEHSSEAM